MMSPGQGVGGYPKLVTKSDIGGMGVHANTLTSPKKLCIHFYFSRCHIMPYCCIMLNSSCVADKWCTGVIFLILKSTLGRRLKTGFLQIFKHVTGSLVDLFNSCQLHISYTKYVNYFLRFLIKEKVCHYLPDDMGERVYEKSD